MNLKFQQNLLTNKLSKIIKRGDVVYMESDLTAFREIFLQCKSKTEFLNFFFQIFKNLIGNKGTLVVPSFSYSWGDNVKIKVFNIKKTKSKTGIFPEYMMNKKEVYRTNDPMFSCLIFGNNKKFFLQNNKNTFGPSSLFEKLLKYNAKLVSFGLNRFDPTFVHYVEQYFDTNIKKIKYRYLKKIHGTIIKNNKQYKDTFYTFLKNKKIAKIYNEKKIKKDLIKYKKLKYLNIFKADIYVVKSKNFFKR